jgi:hypothetical protein
LHGQATEVCLYHAATHAAAAALLQVSAAAFTKGLLALEGSSLTPLVPDTCRCCCCCCCAAAVVLLQVSAAAFTKGLLALEGSSLTPILVSLVTKDASMLDAFGKVCYVPYHVTGESAYVVTKAMSMCEIEQ